MRDVDKAKAAALAPLTGEEIRALRERAHMSQAVFARCLNLTVGCVSQFVRGAKRPTGPALALIDAIRRKGMEAIIREGERRADRSRKAYVCSARTHLI